MTWHVLAGVVQIFVPGIHQEMCHIYVPNLLKPNKIDGHLKFNAWQMKNNVIMEFLLENLWKRERGPYMVNIQEIQELLECMNPLKVIPHTRYIYCYNSVTLNNEI